jgi:hypothetical protein
MGAMILYRAGLATYGGYIYQNSLSDPQSDDKTLYDAAITSW